MRMRTRPLIFALVVVIITLYACAYSLKVAQLADATHRQLVHEERLTEQAGIPLNRSSLIDPKPPAAQDAGVIYEQLTSFWTAHPITEVRNNNDDEKTLASLCQNHLPTPPELSKARTALSRHAHELSLIHAAVTRPFCVLKIHWDTPNPSEIPYPHLSPIRRSARFLESESLVMAADGKYLDAVRNQALCFKVADQAATGKSSIAYLVSVACNSIALNGMCKILYLYGSKPGVATLVHDEIARNFKAPSAALGLRTETVLNIALTKYIRKRGWDGIYELSGGSPSLGDRILQATALNDKLLSAECNYSGVIILQQMRTAIPIADLSYYQSRPTFAALLTELNQKSDLAGMAKTLLPVTEKVVGKRAQIQNDAAIVILATELINKHCHGSDYPSSISTATDMYTGKPLHYRREGGGFVIYTPGYDGTFDGGTVMERPKFAEYVFHYPTPPYYLQPEPVPNL